MLKLKAQVKRPAARALLSGLIALVIGFYLPVANAANALSQRPDVQIFIKSMVKKYHFNTKDLQLLFNKVTIRTSAVKSIKAPLEQKPWYLYKLLFVTDGRTQGGLEFWQKHQAALAHAEKIFGVPASIIVATIGIETKYGQHTGDYRVIDALSSIAFSDSPRAPYFRSELTEFLLLAREQHVNPLKILGSYAGAIGQPQFMPSSYRRYAVKFTGNSPIDLSHNDQDVIASIANYYQKHGWQTQAPIAEPTSYFTSTAHARAKGAKLIGLQDYFGKEYWLAYHNFDVIKRYNTSDLYAMAVFQLSRDISQLRKQRPNG
jgi:membrane-bound lytic murein transglycosylase B